MIRIFTSVNGRKILDKVAKPGVELDDILEIAENEVYDGYADYARVEVDGVIYAEYEV